MKRTYEDGLYEFVVYGTVLLPSTETQIFFPKLSPQLPSITFSRKKVFTACPTPLPPHTLTFKVIYLTSTGLSNSQKKQQLFVPTESTGIHISVLRKYNSTLLSSR
jgi:hypothetical protein